jgi:hypothetical protein
MPLTIPQKGIMNVQRVEHFCVINSLRGVFNDLRVYSAFDLSFKSFDIWAFARHNPHPRF